VLLRQTAAGTSLAQPLIEPATPERSVPIESRTEGPARNVTPQPPSFETAERQGSRPVTSQPVQAGQLFDATAAEGAERISRADDTIAGRPTQAATTSAQPLGEPHDNRTIPLVKEQLATLNSGQLVWQGEAWKGQELEWKITREQKQRGHAVARSWATDLNMELPELGSVGARIRLTGNQIHLALNGEREETLQRMRQGTAKLSEALESAGLQLARVEVERVDPPTG
jgi:flagellar hook-length control protein FliK